MSIDIFFQIVFNQPGHNYDRLSHKIHEYAHEYRASKNDQSKPEQFRRQYLSSSGDRALEFIDYQVKGITDHLRLDDPEIIHQENKKNAG